MPNTANLIKPGYGSWYYGWNVLAMCFVFQSVIFGLTFYCLTFWIRPWMEEFSVSRSQVFLIVILIQVGMGLGAPFAGRAIDQYSLRLLIVLGVLCYAAALAASAFANSLWMVLLCYGTLIVIGNLFAGTLSAQSLAIRWFPANRGMALGLAATGTSFGGLVLPPITAWLIDHYGWRETNIILAIAILFLIPFVLLIIRDRPADFAVNLVSSPSRSKKNHNIGKDFKHWTTASILKEPSFWLLGIAMIAIGASFGAFSQNLAPLAEDLALSSNQASLLVSAMAAVMMLGKFFFGFMADRVDHRYLLWLASGVAILAFALLSTIELDYPMMFIISGFAGFSSGSILPLMGAAISSRFGAASFGKVVGLLSLVMMVGSLGPWVAGYIRDIQGSYTTAWLPMLAMLAIAMLAVAFISPAKGKQE